MIDDNLADQIANLVKAIFEQHQRVNNGGLILLTGFIHALEGRIERHMGTIGAFIAAALENEEDDQCCRLACGLVHDIADNIDKRFT